MNEFDEDEHPHYDDLIRELRELKRFIEGNGDKQDAARNEPVERRADDGNPAVTRADPTPEAPTAEDDPPTLREAVRRPGREDELQLDLLSITRPAVDPDPDPEQEPVPEPAPDPATWREPETKFEPAPLLGPVEVESNRPASGADSRAVLDERHEAGETEDDEIAEFVFDLSDRILTTIEDKLLERSGELLADDLRDDLRESIGELLYQWCER